MSTAKEVYEVGCWAGAFVGGAYGYENFGVMGAIVGLLVGAFVGCVIGPLLFAVALVLLLVPFGVVGVVVHQTRQLFGRSNEKPPEQLDSAQTRSNNETAG